MNSRDVKKLFLEKLPFPGETCRQDMIKSIEILDGSDGNISEIKFKAIREKVFEPEKVVGKAAPRIH